MLVGCDGEGEGDGCDTVGDGDGAWPFVVVEGPGVGVGFGPEPPEPDPEPVIAPLIARSYLLLAITTPSEHELSTCHVRRRTYRMQLTYPTS